MKTIVIMPGGFHPFHAGHAALYQSAVKAFPGADVYVAATNDTKTRPFPFVIKEKLAKLAGVAPGHFIQVKSPFKAEEITSQYNPDEDVLIFVRSEKDRTESPKPGGMKKDGTPAYFQPYAKDQLQSFNKHAYMAYLPTVEFGPGITSATEIRNAWPTLNDKRKTAMVMSLYPVTQKNPALAANVVKMLDMGMGAPEGLSEGSDSKTESYSVADFKIRCFENWSDYLRFLKSPKQGTRDTTTVWPTGVASFLTPNNSTLVSESVMSHNDRTIADKFSSNFKSLDKRDLVKIKVGNSISVLYSVIDLDRKEVELGGFINPKKISDINLDRSGKIDTITFEDGSQFPERNELTNVGGQNITNTIFFPDQATAAAAYTKIWMMLNKLEGHSWSVNHQSLTENRNMCNVCGQTPCNCTYISESEESLEEAQLAGHLDVTGVLVGNHYDHGMLGPVKVIKVNGAESTVTAKSDGRAYKVATSTLRKRISTHTAAHNAYRFSESEFKELDPRGETVRTTPKAPFDNKYTTSTTMTDRKLARRGEGWKDMADVAKRKQSQGVAEGSEANDDLVSLLNSYEFYSDNGSVYVNDAGDKIARIGSNWKHQSGQRGTGAEELGNFLDSIQPAVESNVSESADYLPEK